MDHPVVIIGAGVAGLIAAQHLEQAGFKPLVLEATDRVGGRVKTDEKKGFLLDHGFQVLLTEYREARTYLDFEALDLRRFQAGALVYSGGRSFRLSDPLRDPSRLLSMAFSPVGTLQDKWLIWKLTRELKNCDPSELFDRNGQTTAAFLRAYGFSERIIENFFRPFFGGIFLENELRTGAGMFRFVFRTFSEGFAAVPARGMEEIPRQLAGRLQQTTFRFGEQVARIEGREVHTESGTVVPFQQLIIATDPHQMLPRLQEQETDYRQTENLYFRADRSLLNEPIIALVADEDSPVNNFCVMTDVAPGYAAGEESLVSVTLKESSVDKGIDPETVAAELRRLTGQPERNLSFLQRYYLPRSLPGIEALRYDLPATQFRLTEDIVLAGDHLLNASLDAAMRSGRRAAEAVLQAG